MFWFELIFDQHFTGIPMCIEKQEQVTVKAVLLSCTANAPARC